MAHNQLTIIILFVKI